MAEIVDLASRQDPTARIEIRRCLGGFAVTIEPPSNRPGVCGCVEPTYRLAHFHAYAMQILTGRPVVDLTGRDEPAAA